MGNVKNLGMLIASGAGEGVEEMLESILSPYLQRLSYNKDAETVLENKELWDDAAYEGLIGLILGVFGNGTNQTFGLTNSPDSGHNGDTQNQTRMTDLAAQGEARLRAGEMPTPKQLEAMNLSEAEARGAMAIHQMGKIDGTVPEGSNNKIETSLGTVESLDEFVNTPQKLTGLTGQDLHNYLVTRGYDVQPLSRGSFKGIPFEEGGGFKVNWGGDRILQYHPAKSSHHGGAYFKISSGETGTIRIDMDGNIIK